MKMLINGATLNLMFTPENQEDILELDKLSERVKTTTIMKRPPVQNEIEAVMVDYRQVGDYLLAKKNHCRLKESAANVA